MSKKPEGVVAETGQVDLEEMILIGQLGEAAGKAEYAKRRAAFPDGLVRKVTKLTAADVAAIKAAKYVKVAELAEHFKVSATTIANIRSGKRK